MDSFFSYNNQNKSVTVEPIVTFLDPSDYENDSIICHTTECILVSPGTAKDEDVITSQPPPQNTKKNGHFVDQPNENSANMNLNDGETLHVNESILIKDDHVFPTLIMMPKHATNLKVFSQSITTQSPNHNQECLEHIKLGENATKTQPKQAQK